MLPPAVKALLDVKLHGVSRRDLAVRVARMTEAYRSGRASAHVIGGPQDALAYAVARMPATFAAVGAALARLGQRWPGFAPASLLDLGAGPGTATFAAREAWPGLAMATLVEPNAVLRSFGGEMLAAAPGLAVRWLTLAIDRDRAAWGSADLVVASYLLIELDEAAAGRSASAALEATADCGALVLVEPGTPAGFARIRAARAALIGIGARIIAPCPGDGTRLQPACPMAGTDWCHFTVRLARSRDHKLVKGADAPFEDERFAYLVATRQPSIVPAAARVLDAPRAGRGAISLRLCTATGKVETRQVARSDAAAFKAARRAAWGDEA